MANILAVPITNKAYGYPTRGSQRRIQPRIIGVVHITGNANNQGPHAARNERDYANRKDSNGPSAHYYIDRDGGGIKAINVEKYAAWSNGDLDNPDTSNAGIREILRLKAKGYNPNEVVGVEIELVGYSKSAGQPTAAQLETCAQLLARYARTYHLPINRDTILTHADINSVDRPNCAFIKATREAQMKKLIARVNAIAHPLPKTVVVKWDAAHQTKITTVTSNAEGLKVTEKV